MTSRAASSPMSASRNAAVSAPDRARPRAVAEVGRREDERRHRRDREHDDEEAAERVQSERRGDVAGKGSADRIAAEQYRGPNRADQCRPRRLERQAGAETTGTGGHQTADHEPRHARDGDRLERAHVSARPGSRARRSEVRTGRTAGASRSLSNAPETRPPGDRARCGRRLRRPHPPGSAGSVLPPRPRQLLRPGPPRPARGRRGIADRGRRGGPHRDLGDGQTLPYDALVLASLALMPSTVLNVTWRVHRPHTPTWPRTA